MTPQVVSIAESLSTLKFELIGHSNEEYIKEDNDFGILGKLIDDDEIFIERTNSAMSRVENDDEEWLSVDDFLKELETW